jgi:HJR/Mrr/RecB family endonuclease
MERGPLIDLTITYFKRRGYKIERDVIWEGVSGILRRFDLVLRKNGEQLLVWVKEWKRTVGVNMVINVDKAAADVGFPHPIIISEKFSDHAKAYANRRGVTLLTRRQICREWDKLF